MASKQIAVAGDSDIQAPASAWFIGLAAWAVPGSGHLIQGRWLRGLLLGGAVWGMVVIGFLFGGHFYVLGGAAPGTSALMQVPPMIANIGSGLVYLFCWVTGAGLAEHAHLTTFEYGNTFLMIGGLLNYLLMLDAFDIAAGRKD